MRVPDGPSWDGMGPWEGCGGRGAGGRQCCEAVLCLQPEWGGGEGLGSGGPACWASHTKSPQTSAEGSLGPLPTPPRTPPPPTPKGAPEVGTQPGLTWLPTFLPAPTSEQIPGRLAASQQRREPWAAVPRIPAALPLGGQPWHWDFCPTGPLRPLRSPGAPCSPSPLDPKLWCLRERGQTPSTSHPQRLGLQAPGTPWQFKGPPLATWDSFQQPP